MHSSKMIRKVIHSFEAIQFRSYCSFLYRKKMGSLVDGHLCRGDSVKRPFSHISYRVSLLSVGEAGRLLRFSVFTN
jgi:hypothetical protein